MHNAKPENLIQVNNCCLKNVFSNRSGDILSIWAKWLLIEIIPLPNENLFHYLKQLPLVNCESPASVVYSIVTRIFAMSRWQKRVKIIYLQPAYDMKPISKILSEHWSPNSSRFPRGFLTENKFDVMRGFNCHMTFPHSHGISTVTISLMSLLPSKCTFPYWNYVSRQKILAVRYSS